MADRINAKEVLAYLSPTIFSQRRLPGIGRINVCLSVDADDDNETGGVRILIAAGLTAGRPIDDDDDDDDLRSLGSADLPNRDVIERGCLPLLAIVPVDPRGAGRSDDGRAVAEGLRD